MALVLIQTSVIWGGITVRPTRRVRTQQGLSCACPENTVDENGNGTSCPPVVNDVDDCAGNPCLNGGVCFDGDGEHTCECSNGFEGANCETAATPTCPLGEQFVSSIFIPANEYEFSYRGNQWVGTGVQSAEGHMGYTAAGSWIAHKWMNLPAGALFAGQTCYFFDHNAD